MATQTFFDFNAMIVELERLEQLSGAPTRAAG